MPVLQTQEQTIVKSAVPRKGSLSKAMIKQLRPKQWTKNLLVLASAIFAGTFLELHTMYNALLAFCCFSLVASTVYIINDVIDVEKDRVHPEKCKRPIASGAISVQFAIIMGIILFCCSMFVSFKLNPLFFGVLLIYFIINILYCIRFKHVVIIDVMIIASGFVLRAIAGAVAVGGMLTSWFVLCTLLLSLFLALGKRRHELELFEGDTTKQRKVLQFYSVKLLDQLMTIVTGLTVMFYSLYAATVNQYMMFTVPIVLYGIFRYLYLVHMKNAGGKPEDILLTDKHILFTVVLYGVTVLFLKAYF
jgi:4-hydroxybenzoate polyprenyltransferase